jgi:fluoride ion exporter CrcB/FEX
VGVLGGFTAFSHDAPNLWEARKPLFAFGYVTASVVASLVALVAGATTMRVALT